RRRADEVARRDRDRVPGLLPGPAKVGSEPRGAAEIGNRRVEVAVEIVDREDPERDVIVAGGRRCGATGQRDDDEQRPPRSTPLHAVRPGSPKRETLVRKESRGNSAGIGAA